MVQPATGDREDLGSRFLVQPILERGSWKPPEVGRRMTHWVRKRSLPVRVLVYAATATLAFALAAGVGAIGALTLRGDLGLLEREEPRPADEQDAGRVQQRDGAAEDGAAQDGAAEREEAAVKEKEVASQQDEAAAGDQGVVASQRDETEYVGTVGDIQTRAVDAFLKSHNKLLQYDALAANDVQEMKANETALQDMADQVANLAPPRKYEDHHEVFSVAIDELHEATRLAHGMAADPVAAAELGFDEYDGHVNEASALLQRSNELLGKDYEAIENVREISPEF